jgi:hypothetical protein
LIQAAKKPAPFLLISRLGYTLEIHLKIMPFEHFYFQSADPVTWHWPVRMVLLGPNGDALPGLSPGYWTRLLTDSKMRNRREKHDLALMIGDDLAQTLAWLQDDAAFDADVVAILTTRETFQEAISGLDWAYMHKLCLAIASNRGASGIFILVKDLPLSDWIEQVIVEQAHNSSIIEALKKPSTEGACIYDIKLENDTRLSSLLRGMALGLRNPVLLSTTIAVPAHISELPISPLRLADYLEETLLSASPDELYNSEKMGASSIASITPGLYPLSDNLGFFVFHQHATGEFKIYREHRISEPHLAASNYREIPRYLQARVANNGQLLKHKSSYDLQVRIGLPDASWRHGGLAFPDEMVFNREKLKDEIIQLIFTYNSGDVLQQKDLSLPPMGNSAMVDFTFDTPVEGELFEGDISAYHKNRLIQKVSIGIPLGDKSKPGTVDGLQIKVIFCARKDLGHLATRKDFGGTVFYDGGKGKEGRLSGITKKNPINLNIPRAMDEMLQNIKDDIELAIVDSRNYPQDLNDPKNVELLKKLAYIGNQIFVDHLRKMELSGPLQIVTSRNEYIPLDFVYTYAPPDPNGGLCPNAIAALQEGACQNCMDKQTSPAPHVCPFGFLGFSQVIERYPTMIPGNGSSDYSIQAEPSAGRSTLSILGNILYASSIKVGAVEPNIEADIRSCIVAHASKYSKVDTWKDWTRLTQTENPDTQIMLVHVEPSIRWRVDQLEIGNDMLLQSLLDGTKIKPNPAQRSPLMIAMGCEVANLSTHGFDISNRLLNSGAAIVLSNFTKIRGSQAGLILIQLIQLLSEHPGEEKMLGEVVLRLKQNLLSRGVMASLALIVLGDADWKIKTHV